MTRLSEHIARTDLRHRMRDPRPDHRHQQGIF